MEDRLRFKFTCGCGLHANAANTTRLADGLGNVGREHRDQEAVNGVVPERAGSQPRTTSNIIEEVFT